jgi:hypothetical protein
MGDIKIDGKAFQERMSHFVGAWKADKRSGDALFGGVSSIVILMGKVGEEPEFFKNNAMHVRYSSCPGRAIMQCLATRAVLTLLRLQFWLLGYEFPTTLMLLTPDTMYIVTTQKKGVTLPSRSRAVLLGVLTNARSEIPRPNQERPIPRRGSCTRQGCCREREALPQDHRRHQGSRRESRVTMRFSPRS